jgi:hypothetical protein
LNDLQICLGHLLSLAALGGFDSYKIDHRQGAFRNHHRRAVINILEADAARDLSGIMLRVNAGDEVIIDSGKITVAIAPTSFPSRRSIQSDDCQRITPFFSRMQP